MRSAPVSQRLSTSSLMPRSISWLTTSASRLRYCSAAAWKTGVSGGTTLAMMTSAISSARNPAWAQSVINSAAYSSVVLSRTVATRQRARRMSFSLPSRGYKPSLMPVLLRSTASRRGSPLEVVLAIEAPSAVRGGICGYRRLYARRRARVKHILPPAYDRLLTGTIGKDNQDARHLGGADDAGEGQRARGEGLRARARLPAGARHDLWLDRECARPAAWW